MPYEAIFSRRSENMARGLFRPCALATLPAWFREERGLDRSRWQMFVFCGRPPLRYALGSQKRLHRRRCVFCERLSSLTLGPQRSFAIARPLSPALCARDKPSLVFRFGFTDRGPRWFLNVNSNAAVVDGSPPIRAQRAMGGSDEAQRGAGGRAQARGDVAKYKRPLQTRTTQTHQWSMVCPLSERAAREGRRSQKRGPG